MRKYIIIGSIDEYDGTYLRGKHPIWNTPLRYDNDAILAALLPSDCYLGSGNYLHVFDDLQTALAYQDPRYIRQPIFEVELKDSAQLTTSNSGENQLNPFKHTTQDNLKEVIKAHHAGITYDLSKTWAQRELLNAELKKLKLLEVAERTELHKQIDTLFKLVLSLRGKLPFSELTDTIKETNDFLNSCVFKIDANTGKRMALGNKQDSNTLNKYKQSAKTKQGAPSLGMQAIGICMMALAVAVTLELAVITGTALALAGLGLYKIGSRESGVCKAMNDITRYCSV